MRRMDVLEDEYYCHRGGGGGRGTLFENFRL